MQILKQPYGLLRIAQWVFLVMAFLVGGINLIIGGLVPLFLGGDPIPVLADGTAIPARLFGLLSIVISAPLSFLFLYLPSVMIGLLVDIHTKVVGAGRS